MGKINAPLGGQSLLGRKLTVQDNYPCGRLLIGVNVSVIGTSYSKKRLLAYGKKNGEDLIYIFTDFLNSENVEVYSAKKIGLPDVQNIYEYEAGKIILIAKSCDAAVFFTSNESVVKKNLFRSTPEKQVVSSFFHKQELFVVARHIIIHKKVYFLRKSVYDLFGEPVKDLSKILNEKLVLGYASWSPLRDSYMSNSVSVCCMLENTEKFAQFCFEHSDVMELNTLNPFSLTPVLTTNNVFSEYEAVFDTNYSIPGPFDDKLDLLNQELFEVKQQSDAVLKNGVHSMFANVAIRGANKGFDVLVLADCCDENNYRNVFLGTSSPAKTNNANNRLIISELNVAVLTVAGGGLVWVSY